MITAINAKAAANVVVNDLSNINTLITDATGKGLYQLYVDGNQMNDSMMIDLVSNYGYKVDKMFYDMGTYPTYRLSWKLFDIESFFPNYILMWDFANTDSYTGNPNVYDISGNGDNGTIHNNPINVGGYIGLTGASSQYVINNTDLSSYFTGSYPNKKTKFSIVMSIYPTGNGMIVSETSQNGWHNSILEMVSGTLKYSLWDGSLKTVTSSIATPFNAWYNIVLNYDGTTMTMYVNGNLAGSRSITRIEPYNLNPAKPIYYAFGLTDTTNAGDGTYGDFNLGRVELLDNILDDNEILEKYKFHINRYGA
jgi:hypothetical protein